MYSEISANKRKTIWILLTFVLLIVGLAYLLGGVLYQSSGLTYGLIVGGFIYAAFSYYGGMRMSMALNGAKPITKQDNPRLWRIVENLAITNGMPMPKICIIDDPGMNAFATGRNPEHAAVAATTGLLQALDDNELEGVMAHELGHVKNYDIRVSMLAFALAAVVALIADMLLRAFWFRDNKNSSPIVIIAVVIAAVITPVVASLIQLAISRRREYLADATGALTTRYPEGLASALEKISAGSSQVRRQNPSSAHLFFANPLKKSSFNTLFSTHPPVADRIQKLRNMGNHA